MTRSVKTQISITSQTRLAVGWQGK